MKLKRALPAKDNIPSREAPFFATATSQSPGVPETLATAYNPGMCLWALPVITEQVTAPRMYGQPFPDQGDTDSLDPNQKAPFS